MKRLALTLALLPSIALAQTKPLPWQCDPLTNPDVGYRRIETADGSAVLWACQVNTVARPYEIHYTRAWATPTNVAATLLTFVGDPAGTFWRNAKSSTCLGDPAKSYWPTQQERNLCAAVRAEWAAWGLK